MLWGVFSAFRVTGGCLARWADPAIVQPPRPKSSADNRRVVSRIVSREITRRSSLPIRSRIGNTGDLRLVVSGEGRPIQPNGGIT